MAFELKDFIHLQNSCDLFGQKKIPIIWGPLRHGPGHNIATYHRNPDDQVIEFFCELDQMVDEELGYSSRGRGIRTRRSGRVLEGRHEQRLGPAATARFPSRKGLVIARSEATKQSRAARVALDCFAERAIGPRDFGGSVGSQ